jgi:hypothetical protein
VAKYAHSENWSANWAVRDLWDRRGSGANAVRKSDVSTVKKREIMASSTFPYREMDSMCRSLAVTGRRGLGNREPETIMPSAPKGNVDITGQCFLWTSNIGTGRLEAFIVKVP